MINVCAVAGRLCADPVMRTTAGGKNVTNFRLAVERTKDITDFIQCVAWDQKAEFVSKYFKKGKPAIVRGTLRSRDIESDGKKYSVLEVVVDEINFVPVDNTDRTDGAGRTGRPAVSTESFAKARKEEPAAGLIEGFDPASEETPF